LLGVLEIHLFWGQKVKGLDNAILPLAAYVSHAGFSLLQCPAMHTSHASDSGFFPRHLPADDAAAATHNHARQTDRRFFHTWNFSQLASGKNIAVVGLCTLVIAALF